MFYLHCSIRLSRLILSPFCMNTFYQSCYVIPHPFENVIFFFLQNMFEDGHKISLDSQHESLETQSGSGVLTRTTYTCLTDLFKWKHKFSNEILRFKVFFFGKFNAMIYVYCAHCTNILEMSTTFVFSN